MTEFEKESEYFFEHLKQLGYAKVVRCEECKWNPMKSHRDSNYAFAWCWHSDNIGYCEKGEKE